MLCHLAGIVTHLTPLVHPFTPQGVKNDADWSGDGFTKEANSLVAN